MRRQCPGCAPPICRWQSMISFSLETCRFWLQCRSTRSLCLRPDPRPQPSLFFQLLQGPEFSIFSLSFPKQLRPDYLYICRPGHLDLLLPVEFREHSPDPDIVSGVNPALNILR